MAIPFNADEVLKIAEQIERNGVEFYRRAAEKSAFAAERRLLEDLAQMEERHEKVFAAMREDLNEEERASTVFDPEGEADLYLKAVANGNVFNLKAGAADPGGDKSLEDILRIAIGMEKDSIVFYTTMSGFVPPRLGREKIMEIIGEEQKHIGMLGAALRSLKTGD